MNQSIAAALDEAGIFQYAHERCAAGWLECTGQELKAEDVDAWSDYVREENMKRVRSLSSGFVVFSLTQGFAAPEANYFNVRLHDDVQAFILS